LRLDTPFKAQSSPIQSTPQVANIGASGFLKQFPAYLNRWDSQQARNEGVFAH